MIEISQKTAMHLRETAPQIHIHKTMQKKSSRGKYYIEETSKVKKLLRAYSGFEKAVSEYLAH